MKQSIAALFPPLGKGSGGLRTAVSHLSALARHGYECHAYVEGDATVPELQRALRQHYDCDNVIAHSGWLAPQHHDLVLATMWHTANALAAAPGQFHRAYLVQDFEPFFYPMGGPHLLAENSYKHGLQIITMGRWLAEKLQRDCGVTARALDFCADAATYHPNPGAVAKEFAIAFAYHPEKPHRAAQTCVAALQLLRTSLPHLKIYTFGHATGPKDLATKHLGLLTPAQLNDLYNRCLAGLCISMTNPSRLPFEMMAVGLPVVEAHRENNLYDLPGDGVVLAELNAEGLKDALVDLLADQTRRQNIARAAHAFMRKRPAELEQQQFLQHIEDILAGRPAKKTRATPLAIGPYRRALPSCNSAVVGTSRCEVPARAPAGGTNVESRSTSPCVAPLNAVLTAQRAVPTTPAFDLVTVDVWDTLLRRHCHPDEIKLFTARRLQLAKALELKPGYEDPMKLVKERVRCERAIGQQRQRQGMDDEYAIHEVFVSWLAAVLAVPSPPAELDKMAADLVAAELAQERRCIYADPGIKALLDTIPARRRMFLSDFYMPGPLVAGLLRDAGADAVPEGITSCETWLNKRTGRLFRGIQKELGIAPARHAHVGDNEYSDYLMPRTLGMTGVLYLNQAEQEKRDRFVTEFKLRSQEHPEGREADKDEPVFLPEELKRWTTFRNEDLDALPAAEALRRYGEALSPLLVNFALFLAEEALKAGLPKLFFFTREGEFFAEVYSAVAKADPFGVPFPEPVILEVSRLATFSASLTRFDLAEFMRLWNLYSSQSLHSFFTSLDFDPAPVAKLIERHGLKLDETIRHPWTDKRVQALFADAPFVQFLSAAAAEKRALFLDYLKSKGLQGNEAKIGVVDIGWRGTIQDNLAWVLPNTKVFGWYFGLLPFLNVQPPNAVKAAFGPGRPGDDKELVRLLEYVSPLEMLCNSASGSTLRYERRDGAAAAEHEKNPDEEAVFHQFTRHFQDGVLSRIQPVAGLIGQRAIGAQELRPLSLDLLSRIVHEPPRAVAEAYFNLNHNETFGVGEFDNKRRHRNRVQFARNLYEAGAIGDFERELSATTWPQGFARLCDIEHPFFGRDNSQPRELPLPRRRAAREAGAEALQFYRGGQLAAARAAALRSLAIDPWRLNVQHLLYRVALDQSRVEEAMHRFRLIRLLHPEHAPTLNEFARRSFEAGLAEKAIQLLDEIVKEQPGYRPAVLNLCRAHLDQGDFLQALAVLNDSLEAIGGDPEFLRFRALVQLFAGRGLLADAGKLVRRLPKALADGSLPSGLRDELQHALMLAGDPLRARELDQFTKLVSDDDYLGIRRSAGSGAAIANSQSPIASPQPLIANAQPAIGNRQSAMASVIVLAMNQLEHTRKCVESLLAHTRAPFEIILVDNGSTDGTAEYFAQLREAHSNIKVVANKTNRGFAAGNNQGLSLACGELLVLLNNDTVVTPGWIEGMAGVVEQNPGTGVVGPMTNCASGIQVVPEPGYADLSELPAFATTWARVHAGKSIEVNRAVGFCLLATRAVIESIGGLDEQFGSGNFEDDDFCIRARLAGFGVRMAQPVFIHHTGSQTFQGARIDFAQAMLRNWKLFTAKWRLGPEATPERGYPNPEALPEGVDIKVSLPSLTRGSECDRCWTEQVVPRDPRSSRCLPRQSETPAGEEAPSQKPATEIPAVARLGNLDEAKALLGRRDFASAWQATLAAIRVRPFHPEAWLLLAEIALAAGDSASARQCALRARDLAPNWKAPKQFLQKPLKGNTRLDWLTLPGAASPRLSTLDSRLSVCVIAKNEEQFLAQCLKSVKDVAAQLIVVDTGSTDRTVEIAKEHGAEVHHFEWCDDFGAARNAALEHATGDWILMLDADEELPAGQHPALQADLKKAGALAFRLPLTNRGQEAEGQSYVPRLFRNAPGTFYRGRIHEQVFSSLLPFCKSWGMETALGTARLLHHGYAKEVVQSRQKIERNLLLLRQAITEQPDDINLQMNLGLELVRSGDLANGIARYRDAFHRMSAQPANEIVPELREVLLTQFTTHLYKLREHGEVVRILTSPLAKNGGLTASLCFALGLASFELKQYRDAAEQMRRCLSKRKEPALSPINTDILTAAPQHCLALSLARLGEAAGAEKAFQAALKEKGRLEAVKLDLTRFLMDQNRPVDALHLLHELVAEDSQCAAAWRLGGEIALSQADFLEFAYDWTCEAIRYLPDDPIVIAQRAEVLLLREEVAHARPLWERACNGARPPRALAAFILCSAADSQAIPPTRDTAEETAVSRSFIEWYQRLLQAGARQTIVRLNSRVDAFRGSLPTAARLLDSALAQVGPDSHSSQ